MASPKKIKAKAKPKKAAAKKVKTSKAKKAKPKKKREDLNCFLTTACVKYYGLPDNADELTILRVYRDSFLMSDNEGRQLIKEYYRISPKIVEQLNKDPQRKQGYAFIYKKIKEACVHIRKQKNESAKNVYVHLVKTLQQTYQVI